MSATSSIWVLLLLLLLLSGCEKSYYVEYTLANRSARTVYFTYRTADDTTSRQGSLSHNFDLILRVETGEGERVDKYVAALDTLPLFFTSFRDEAGDTLTCPINQIDCWTKVVAEKDGWASVRRRILASSFE